MYIMCGNSPQILITAGAHLFCFSQLSDCKCRQRAVKVKQEGWFHSRRVCPCTLGILLLGLSFVFYFLIKVYLYDCGGADIELTTWLLATNTTQYTHGKLWRLGIDQICSTWQVGELIIGFNFYMIFTILYSLQQQIFPTFHF